MKNNDERKKQKIINKIYVSAILVLIAVFIIVTISTPEDFEEKRLMKIPEIHEINCYEDQLGIRICEKVCKNKYDASMILPKEDCGL